MKFVTLQKSDTTFRSSFVRLSSCLLAATAFSTSFARGGEISIANPGFEEDLKGWDARASRQRDTPPPSVTTEQARSGEHSLKLDAFGSGKGHSTLPHLAQTIRNLKPDSVYYLTAWAKGGSGGRGSIRVATKLEYYNAEGKNTHGINGYHSLLENGEWDRIEAVGRTAADTTHGKIYVRNMEKGATVYFDDVQLSQPELIVVEPTRLLHYPGKETPVAMTIWTNKPLKDDAQVDLIATHGDNETRIRGNVEKIADQTYQIKAVLPAIESGHYTLTAAIGNERSPVAARTFASVENRKPSRLSDTGTILHQGKPFFPIGIYHPQNWTYYRLGATRDDVEGVIDDYARLAEMGFNAVQGSSTRNIEMFGRYLDEAWKHGLVVDVPFYARAQVLGNLDNSLEKIQRFKNHPAVLNWKISDEPDMRPSIVNEVPEAYIAYKKADPDTPIEVTLATDNALSAWSSFADIIQINRYPLPGGDLTAVSDYTRLAVQNKQPWQNLSYVVQSGWTKPGTVPTPEELRSMIYLALIEGAKGIWYYTMYDPGFDLSKESIWPHLKEINAEIASLSQAVMLGELETGVKPDNAKLYCRALEHEAKLYVMMTNPERTQQKGTLSLPEKWANAKVQTLGGKEVKMVRPGKIALDFAPVDSRTLIFTK